VFDFTLEEIQWISEPSPFSLKTMKIYIFLLILAAFLQTSFVPFNLVLLLLIARAYVIDDSTNLYAAFASGIFLGILSSENIGFLALTFLIAVKIASLMRKLPISTNVLTIIPVSFIIILLVTLSQNLLFSESLNLPLIIQETIISLPIFLGMRFWEERFLGKSDLRLKIKR
jgi:hypothetical protein